MDAPPPPPPRRPIRSLAATLAELQAAATSPTAVDAWRIRGASSSGDGSGDAALPATADPPPADSPTPAQAAARGAVGAAAAAAAITLVGAALSGGLNTRHKARASVGRAARYAAASAASVAAARLTRAVAAARLGADGPKASAAGGAAGGVAAAVLLPPGARSLVAVYALLRALQTAAAPRVEAAAAARPRGVASLITSAGDVALLAIAGAALAVQRVSVRAPARWRVVLTAGAASAAGGAARYASLAVEPMPPPRRLGVPDIPAALASWLLPWAVASAAAPAAAAAARGDARGGGVSLALYRAARSAVAAGVAAGLVSAASRAWIVGAPRPRSTRALAAVGAAAAPALFLDRPHIRPEVVLVAATLAVAGVGPGAGGAIDGAILAAASAYLSSCAAHGGRPKPPPLPAAALTAALGPRTATRPAPLGRRAASLADWTLGLLPGDVLGYASPASSYEDLGAGGGGSSGEEGGGNGGGRGRPSFDLV